jgi:lysophospholipase L1-like esterase
VLLQSPRNVRSTGLPSRSRSILMTAYCVGLFLVFDLIYSNLPKMVADDPSPRTTDARFHHGLISNFVGHQTWAKRYRFFTDSLGFKDASARDVPLTAGARRILLIGDSFTEGIGLPFEETFAGMLSNAGQQRADKTEFLNAGVVSYSPVLYYRKIEYLIGMGLQFDEVVVLPDLTDVWDEATGYFCFDDAPQYRNYCRSDPPPPPPPLPEARPRSFSQLLGSNFQITDFIRVELKNAIRQWRYGKADWFKTHPTFIRSRWTVEPGLVDGAYAPLGIEGGITRALGNMQALAALLAAHRIPLTIAVYPWPDQLAGNDRQSRQVAIWREFCVSNCKAFIDLFPVFFTEKDKHADWYERLYIKGDVHFSAAGNRLIFQELARHLL